MTPSFRLRDATSQRYRDTNLFSETDEYTDHDQNLNDLPENSSVRRWKEGAEGAESEKLTSPSSESGRGRACLLSR